MRTSWRLWALDIALVIGLCAADLILSTSTEQSEGPAGGAARIPYAAVGFALLLARRSHPSWVMAGMVVHSVAAWWLSPGYVPTLGVWVALFTVAAHRRFRIAALAFAGSLLVIVNIVMDALRTDNPAFGDRTVLVLSTVFLLLTLVVFSAGRWVRWAARQRAVAAERAAKEAVTTERRRIARELHDIVAHAVTLMVLQSAGASRQLRTNPDRAEEALNQVDELGQQAIVELGRMLDVLVDGDDQADQPEERLAELDRIVARVSSDELPVQLTTTGTPVLLDLGVDLAACRIIQEALTNAARYAARNTPIEITLDWYDDRVEIVVRNRVRPTIRPWKLSLGRGIIGMRERARSAGADFSASTRPGGFFVVRVCVPTASPSATKTPDEPIDSADDDSRSLHP